MYHQLAQHVFISAEIIIKAREIFHGPDGSEWRRTNH